MSNKGLREVYVFPLEDVVFYPNTAVPLNIFEPRYIQMVRDSLSTGTPIALVMSQRTHSKSKSDQKFSGVVAGIGEPKILHENEDGTMVILLKGLAKVSLLEVISEKPYYSCWAEEISEIDEVSPGNRFRVNRFRTMLRSWVDDNLEDPSERMHFLKAMRSPQQMIDSMAMFFVEESDERQNLLEKNDINQKIEFLSETIKSLPKASSG